MNFHRRRLSEEPEINLIPMIDVLLVIVIFLMVTTTYAKFSGLELELPTADATQTQKKLNNVDIAITARGDVLINHNPVGSAQNIDNITLALRKIRTNIKETDETVVIDADAKSTHQSVINVMQALQRAGFSHISFAVQQKP